MGKDNSTGTQVGRDSWNWAGAYKTSRRTHRLGEPRKQSLDIKERGVALTAITTVSLNCATYICSKRNVTELAD